MNVKRSVAVGAGAALFALLAVATPLLGAGREKSGPNDLFSRSRSFANAFTNPRPALRPASQFKARKSTSTARSFYYYHGQPVRLERSPSELSVRYSAGVSRVAGRKLVRGFAPSTRAQSASRLRGRDLSVVSLARGSRAGLGRLLDRLKARSDVDFAYPAWVDPKTGGRLLLTDEVIVRLGQGSTPARAEVALAARGLVAEEEISRGSDVYVLRLSEPKRSDPLTVSRALVESGLVVWAEPNFVQEFSKDYVPNDAFFSQQWSLDNSGQGNGSAGADARLGAAWDLEKGNRDTTIAVIDDGVQLSHPDLAANIYTNPREILDNHVDDDRNGFTDDVHGWNFIDDSKNVNPAGNDEYGDNHGTAVAGVAAARGDNSVGISGACPNCTILPIKISNEEDWGSDATIANAIVYAGRMADVLNISWGGSEPSSVLEFALQYAQTTGRDGKGAVILASAGNAASGYLHYTLSGLPPDTYRFRWVYSKDASDSFDVGADTAWLAWVRFSDGEIRNFEAGGSGLPSGWASGGDGGVSWSTVSDPEHSDEGHCWSHAAKAGKISNNQQTYVESVKTLPDGGNIDFLAFVSSEMGSYMALNGEPIYWPLDGLRLLVDEGNDGSYEWSDEDLYAGIPPTGLVYPAAFSQVIAVGASTSFDCRAAYSQFGPELDLVVPSSGGGLSNAVLTTDRTGQAGYSSGDYFADFGGTSSAAPLAAGIAGLVLSRNPGLTATQVREILERSADKVNPGSAAYDAGGHSDRYGYGRINALKALEETPLPSFVSFSRSSYRASEGRGASITIRRSGNTARSASVAFATVGRTARAGRDFAIVSRWLRFVPGQRSKTVKVWVKGDRIHEPVEIMNLKLTNPSPGAALAQSDRAQLAIIDNDARSGSIASASLSRTDFESDQTTGIKLLYDFARCSGTFGFVLSRKEGKGWIVIQSIRRIGDFKGAHRLPVRTLFAGKPVAPGEYRLRLRADTNSRWLTFRVD